MMDISILKNKKFLPLLVSHFLSAINNNFIRTVFLFFVTYKMTVSSVGLLITAALLFAISFCVSSLFLGTLADKIGRNYFLIFIRLLEISIMILAFGCVAIDSKFLFTLLLPLMGMLGAGLRIADYSLIPQLNERKDLNEANAFLKMMTMLALGIATLFMVSVLKLEVSFTHIFVLGIILSCLSLGITFLIPKTEPQDSQLIIFQKPKIILSEMIGIVKNKFDLVRYLTGIAWFWAIMTTVAIFAGEYGDNILHVRWSTIMFLTVIFAFGYVLGSVFYLRVSKGEKTGSYVPAACLTISFLLLDLVLVSHYAQSIRVSKDLTIAQLLFTKTTFTYWHIVFALFILGGACAFYIIPFYTLLQQKAVEKNFGRLMAFSNIINAMVVLGTFFFIFVMKSLFFNLLDFFVIIAFLTFGLSFYMLHLLPFEMQQKLWRRVLKKLFKVRVEGFENFEKASKRTLIIANHMSYLDILLISAFINKKIVFAVNEKIMKLRLIRLLTGLVDVRPFDSSNPLAVKAMVEELKQDKLCMVFTHGLVKDGNTRLKIYEGAAMMAYKSDADILPIRITGSKYTFFSRVIGERADFRFFPKISLAILPPQKFKLPEHLTIRQIREKISSQLYDIVNNMAFQSQDTQMTIFKAALQCMRTIGRLPVIIEDTTRKPMKFISVFLKAFVLGRVFGRVLKDQQRIGIILPTSNTCAVTFMALHAIGKTPAMINFSSGETQVLSTCKTIGLKTIITAKKVVSLAKLESLIESLEKNGIEILYLEDVAKKITLKDKIFGMIGSFFPERAYHFMEKTKNSPNDTAVILFTSGSEGMPKAVFLSHQNILSNVFQAVYRIDVTREDVILNCLPMFHSFGLMAGLFLPLVVGVRAMLYPTPLHYRVIPEICASVRATIFVGTDTFLMGYAKCANPYDFNSLRLVVAGAEKLKDETRKIWLEKFGIRVLEGYGATECAPILSLGTLIHNKPGSVGRLFPGMEYKLQEIEGIKEGKELWVRGPNVMQGYMRSNKPMDLEPLKEGWYDTGDIVEIDEEGYIFIKGRCKRFAKIGGEMVSLLNVEMIVQQKWPDFVSGAVNIPDERKGEKIVLITTNPEIKKEDLIKAFKAAGASEISIPSQIIFTQNPPLLGSGKFDYMKAKEIAKNA